jgi:hypothetical protein
MNEKKTCTPTVTLLIVLIFAFFLFSRIPCGSSSTAVAMSGEPIKLYIVDLDDVGGVRAANHSAVVEGAKQATFINIDQKLSFDSVNVYVNASYELVHDWQTYKHVVETTNNTIIVNTHDEILPVPEGYTKEAWTDSIADFMLNRWGTWVHAGGYPLYRVAYQNGTKEEYGEDGFKRLMSHIGKENITCYTPQGEMGFANFVRFWDLSANWFTSVGENIAYFAEVNVGCPINYLDFEQKQVVAETYGYENCSPGITIRFSRNQSTLNFGLYVHFGAWQFFTSSGNVLPSEFAVGFISTASGIYDEFYYTASKLYGRAGDSASEAIKTAENEGRTVGLAEAENLFQNALDAFAAENYKLSAAFAIQAKLTAEEATAPSSMSQLIATIAVIGCSLTTGVGTYYKLHNKKRKRE